MAVPTNKASFKQYCLENLGQPVIKINVSDEQVDNRVDFALQKFYDYHMDASDKIYYKYQLTPNNHSTSIYDLTIANGGINYTNGDLLTFTGNGSEANGYVQTNGNGTITSLVFTNGKDYANPPTIGITTSTGSNASITSQLGGFIPLPENIIGVNQIFDVGISASSSNILWNLKYQMVLSDLYMFNNLEIVPYYTAMQNVALIEEILVGKQPLRFNRYQNKLYIDMDYSQIEDGNFIIVECYQVIDPATYPEVWSNWWLQEYATCLIKLQWGSNLKKFGNMQMPGGMSFNGQEIYDEAVQEKKELEYELINSLSIPVSMFVG